jgi:hypothetical protein
VIGAACSVYSQIMRHPIIEVSDNREYHFPIDTTGILIFANDASSMSVTFASSHHFIEVHDEIPVSGKWGSTGNIYLGSSPVRCCN